jgi:hypothetical protein
MARSRRQDNELYELAREACDTQALSRQVPEADLPRGKGTHSRIMVTQGPSFENFLGCGLLDGISAWHSVVFGSIDR